MTALNNRPEMRVIIVGNTGKGKSSLGNSLLGSKKFPTTSGGTSGGKPSEVSSSYGMIQLPDRTSLAVVDTPGLLDDHLYVKNQIGSYLELLSPGPHVFLFVVRVGRFTQGELATFRRLIDIFGEEILNFLIVIFTGKDDLAADDISIEVYLQDIPDGLRDLLNGCKRRYAAINNRAKGDNLRKDVDYITDLIRKTIDQNGDNFYTMEMFKHAQANYREQVRKRDAVRKSKKSNDKPKGKDRDFFTVKRVAIAAVALLIIWGCYKYYTWNW